MNEEKLLKYAVEYLSKYDSSKKNLLSVLKRKIFRLKIPTSEKSILLNIRNDILIKLDKNNLINDERYSLSKINSLSKSGKSRNYIINYLIKKGIDKSDISKFFLQFQEDNDEWELKSAIIYAEKKKLLTSNENYEKKLAKMARAGFNYEICKKILN